MPPGPRSGSGNGQFDPTNPWDLAFANNGDMYITDFNNNRIQIFNSTGIYKKQISITQPLGIAFIDSIKIVVDWRITGGCGKVSVLDTTGMLINEWDGTLRHPAITANGNIMGFNSAGGKNPKVVVYSPEGDLLARFGRKGNQDSDFNSPYDLTVDQLGNVYIADNDGQKIMVFLLPKGL